MYEDIETMRRILDGMFQHPRHRPGAQPLAEFARRPDAAVGGMGTGVVDYDADGKLDLIIGNFAGGDNSTTLFHNIGNGKFEEVHWLNQGPATCEAVEGYYLKSEGVMFSVSLPVHFHESLNKPKLPARKTLSQWERVQKELHGEKVDADSGRPEQKNDTIADAVLRLLAENGRHFTQLAENERLTVAITLRSPQCSTCHGTGGTTWNMPNGTTNWGTPSDTTSWATPQAAMMGGGSPGMSNAQSMMGAGVKNAAVPRGVQFLQRQQQTQKQGAPQNQGQAASMAGMMGAMQADAANNGLNAANSKHKDLDAEARDQALLGDLQGKQGRHKEAAAAYQKAVGLYQQILDGKGANPAPFQDPRAAMQSYLTAVGYATKLAQAQEAAGDADKALNALKEVTRYSTLLEQLAQKEHEKSKQAQGAQTTEAKNARTDRGTALPAKLIISAPKKLFDMIGAGKISFDDFRKAATIEYLAFGSSNEKSASAK
jgi:tetratricopeptide (TPR) repeat protein